LTARRGAGSLARSVGERIDALNTSGIVGRVTRPSAITAGTVLATVDVTTVGPRGVRRTSDDAEAALGWVTADLVLQDGKYDRLPVAVHRAGADRVAWMPPRLCADAGRPDPGTE
jgi:hypothetical protein